MRTEQEIFRDLLVLCTSVGYVHALALICYHDNMVMYAGEIGAPDFINLFRPERLIRTEINTLVGLMLTDSIDFTIPPKETAQIQIERSYALLEELHHAMTAPTVDDLRDSIARKSVTGILSQGSFLREPMFYSGESAYSFQFRDLAPSKYSEDDAWLKTNKGFTIESAQKVVRSIQKVLNSRLADTIERLAQTAEVEWTVLPGFSFTAADLVSESQINESEINKVIDAFAVSEGERNAEFGSMHDFNVVNAMPILRNSDGTYFLLEQYNLVQALYETPFYWMGADKAYVDTAMTNRGKFTERFARERLQLVFGRSAIYPNVKVRKQKGKDAGEIDTLVLFGNRAIVVQAKSKRLTLEARRGNDLKIKEDFKKSVQDAYDQGKACADMLVNGDLTFETIDGKPLSIPSSLKEVFILCIVSDHYPALSFQASQFLTYTSDEIVKPPFVLDVFTLDTMTEMLRSPLALLSYINRRTGYSERISAGHELTVLAYHLKHNLWIESGTDHLFLTDDISVDLDVAMTVRRDGIPGESVIEGPLTHIQRTVLGRLLRAIESRPDPKTIDLGYSLLTLSGQTVTNLSKQIEAMTLRTREDGGSHDLSIPMGATQEGLTVHCNSQAISVAGPKLERHCSFRKYKGRARRWFGVCLNPYDGTLRFGITLDFPWERDFAMEEDMRLNFGGGRTIDMNQGGRAAHKIGRNDPCPCQSGKKYKHCCLD
jgi:hypothetical protein